MNEEKEGMHGPRCITRWHLLKGQIEDTPPPPSHARIWSIYLPAKYLPFSLTDEISHSLRETQRSEWTTSFFKFVRIGRLFYVAGLVLEVYYAERSFSFSCELLQNFRFLIHFILFPGKYERWLMTEKKLSFVIQCQKKTFKASLSADFSVFTEIQCSDYELG